MAATKLPPLPSLTSFSSELINARSIKGLTQSQLASASGLSLSALKAYESGRNMPGSRELRELCQALGISPNKLLFGTEFPFKEPSIEDLMVDNPEHEMASHARVTALLRLVAADDRKAVITLLQSLALARHGEERVKTEIRDADATFAVMLSMMKVAEAAQTSDKPLSVSEVAERTAAEMEKIMANSGHISEPKKLPKK